MFDMRQTGRPRPVELTVTRHEPDDVLYSSHTLPTPPPLSPPPLVNNA